MTMFLVPAPMWMEVTVEGACIFNIASAFFALGAFWKLYISCRKTAFESMEMEDYDEQYFAS